MPKHRHTFTFLRHEDDLIADWLNAEPFFAEADTFYCTGCLEYKTKILRDSTEEIVARTKRRFEERNKTRKRGWF